MYPRCTQDPSNRRLNEHGIYIRHCQGSNSRPVPSQAGADTTRPSVAADKFWLILVSCRRSTYLKLWIEAGSTAIADHHSAGNFHEFCCVRTQQNSWESPAEWWSVWPHWHSGSILWWPQGSNFDTSSWHRHNYHRNATKEEHKHHRRARASFYELLSLYYIL